MGILSCFSLICLSDKTFGVKQNNMYRSYCDSGRTQCVLSVCRRGQNMLKLSNLMKIGNNQ